MRNLNLFVHAFSEKNLQSLNKSLFYAVFGLLGSAKTAVTTIRMIHQPTRLCSDVTV